MLVQLCLFLIFLRIPPSGAGALLLANPCCPLCGQAKVSPQSDGRAQREDLFDSDDDLFDHRPAAQDQRSGPSRTARWREGQSRATQTEGWEMDGWQ